jgi:hypothetical protein
VERGQSTIGIFPPQGASLQKDCLAFDVIAEPETTEPNSVLPFASGDGFEFPDGMLPAPVIGVRSQNLDDGPKNFCQFGVLPAQFLEFPIKPARREDKEHCGHLERR